MTADITNDLGAATRVVEQMEQAKDGETPLQELRNFPREIAGAALTARFATGKPIAFRENGRNVFRALEKLVADLRPHVTGTPLWPHAVTLVEEAILAGDPASVERHLLRGADPNSAMLEEPTSLLVTAIAQTYLDCASARAAKPHLRIVELLLAHGASTRTKLESGPWQCKDFLFRVSDNAMSIATKLCGMSDTLDYPSYKDWEFIPFDDKTRAKMQPALDALFEMIETAHQASTKKPQKKPATRKKR